MKNCIKMIILIVSVSSVSSIGNARTMLVQPDAGITEFNVRRPEGLRRSLLYAPKLNRFAKAKPLIIVLHGGRGDADKARRNTNFQFEEMADQKKFFVVYPQALPNPNQEGGQWKDGRDHYPHLNSIDDIAYINKLIDRLTKKYSAIDKNNVFVTGASNGGMMTQNLACQLSHKIKGFAPVIAGMPTALSKTCKMEYPRPFLLIMGTSDPLMQYHSQFVHNIKGQPVLGERLTAINTLQFWLKENRCKRTTSNTVKLPNIDKVDESHIIKDSYQCINQQDLLFYTVVGGGHYWPGVKKRAGKILKQLLGNPNNDINGPEVVSDFFLSNLE